MRSIFFKKSSVVGLWIVCTTLLLSAANIQASESVRTLLVVGDSLSAGYGIDVEDSWVSLLQNQLDEEGYGYKVVNASISGDTTGNGAKRLPRALNLHQPDIVIIELGGNDGLRALPIEIMRENLTEMIKQSRELGATVILAGIQIPPNYGEDYASEFSATYTSLADEYSLPLVPFFMENIALDPSKFQADGIHPNAEAQPILLENVWLVLGPVLDEGQAAMH